MNTHRRRVAVLLALLPAAPGTAGSVPGPRQTVVAGTFAEFRIDIDTRGGVGGLAFGVAQPDPLTPGRIRLTGLLCSDEEGGREPDCTVVLNQPYSGALTTSSGKVRLTIRATPLGDFSLTAKTSPHEAFLSGCPTAFGPWYMHIQTTTADRIGADAAWTGRIGRTKVRADEGCNYLVSNGVATIEHEYRKRP